MPDQGFVPIVATIPPQNRTIRKSKWEFSAFHNNVYKTIGNDNHLYNRFSSVYSFTFSSSKARRFEYAIFRTGRCLNPRSQFSVDLNRDLNFIFLCDFLISDRKFSSRFKYSLIGAGNRLPIALPQYAARTVPASMSKSELLRHWRTKHRLPLDSGSTLISCIEFDNSINAATGVLN